MSGKRSRLSPQAEALRDYMSELSEEAYDARWMQHLEFALWHAIVAGPMRYGRLDVTAAHIRELRRLSDACGGWVYFDREHEDTWVPLEEWQDLYSRNIELVRLP